jgi:hypothetical protein
LIEVQLNWGVSAKNVDENLELLAIGVDLFDFSGELAERSFHDADRVALLPRNLWRFFAGFQIGHDSANFIFLERYWLIAALDEAGDAALGLDELESIVRQRQLQEEVAREDFAIPLVALSASSGHFPLCRYQDLINISIPKTFHLGSARQNVFNFVFVAGNRVHGIPRLRH